VTALLVTSHLNLSMPRITIPDDELRFSFSRSGGPGGQNVNKVNSKATLHWNPAASTALPDDVRGRFLARFASRLTNEGYVVITSQESRDQPKNIDSCVAKLHAMIAEVLKPPKRRRPTKPTKGSKLRRLKEKKQRSETKAGRRSVRPAE
jgi:ribosome-associated protein